MNLQQSYQKMKIFKFNKRNSKKCEFLNKTKWRSRTKGCSKVGVPIEKQITLCEFYEKLTLI